MAGRPRSGDGSNLARRGSQCPASILARGCRSRLDSAGVDVPDIEKLPAPADPPDCTGNGPANLTPSTEPFGELKRPNFAAIDQAFQPDPARLHLGDLEMIFDL